LNRLLWRKYFIDAAAIAKRHCVTGHPPFRNHNAPLAETLHSPCVVNGDAITPQNKAQDACGVGSALALSVRLSSL
jgi:hypothetical protein